MFKNSALIVFIIAVLVGAFVSIRSWDGLVFWYPGNERVPAAIKKVFDFSHLEGRALEMASYKRLVADAVIHKSEQGIGVELGHFVIPDEQTNKQFACDYYRKLEMTFHSANMSVNGSPSVMIVEADCEKLTDDVNRMQTVWIPFPEILKQREGDIELQFREHRTVNLSFKNIGDTWPRSWVLTSVKLFDEDHLNRLLNIDEPQMQEIVSQPLSFVWGN